MKTSFIVILFLLCSQVLSQIDKRDYINHKDVLKERINYGLNPYEQIKHPLESINFQNKESKRIINKIYLDNGFLSVEIIYQRWNGSNWENYSKYSSTYDAYNNLNERLLQDWDGSDWVNEEKYIYTYDANNNMIEELVQIWDGSDWVNEAKYIYTYDANNNLIERLGQRWDGTNWVNYLEKSTYTYDANNNMIEFLSQLWDGSNWENSRK
ncbi:hypothetical protein ACFLS9_07595, partial [Bacteroidota bacterium]